jgi:hypothetical protein
VPLVDEDKRSFHMRWCKKSRIHEDLLRISKSAWDCIFSNGEIGQTGNDRESSADIDGYCSGSKICLPMSKIPGSLIQFPQAN